MITGDNVLTAAHVGKLLGFGNGESLFCKECKGEGKLSFYDSDDKLAK